MIAFATLGRTLTAWLMFGWVISELILVQIVPVPLWKRNVVREDAKRGRLGKQKVVERNSEFDSMEGSPDSEVGI